MKVSDKQFKKMVQSIVDHIGDVYVCDVTHDDYIIVDFLSYTDLETVHLHHSFFESACEFLSLMVCIDVVFVFWFRGEEGALRIECRWEDVLAAYRETTA